MMRRTVTPDVFAGTPFARMIHAHPYRIFWDRIAANEYDRRVCAGWSPRHRAFA